MTPMRKKVQRPRPRPERPPGTILQAMKHHPHVTTIVALLLAGLVAVIAGAMPGCASVPAHQPVVAPQPGDPVPPPPDVGAQCSAKVQSMQAAVAVAKLGAALLVGSNSQYGPALKVALVAVDAALAAAQAQCAAGNIDGWVVALAAFDGAMAQLAASGDELAASSVPNDIMPPPPYAVSLDRFATLVLAEEQVGTADDE